MVPGLNSGEFLRMIVEIARLMKPEIYVELGVRQGKTFEAIAPLAGCSIAVDKERGNIPDLIRRRRLAGAAFFHMSTDEFAEYWAQKKRPIDLLFIDADHRKEQVLADFDHFSPWVRPDRGLILLHDTLPASADLLAPKYCGSAWEAAREIRTNEKYRGFEILTLPGKWVGLSLVRKSTRQLFWQKNGPDEKPIF